MTSSCDCYWLGGWGVPPRAEGPLLHTHTSSREKHSHHKLCDQRKHMAASQLTRREKNLQIICLYYTLYSQIKEHKTCQSKITWFLLPEKKNSANCVSYASLYFASMYFAKSAMTVGSLASSILGLPAMTAVSLPSNHKKCCSSLPLARWRDTARWYRISFEPSREHCFSLQQEWRTQEPQEMVGLQLPSSLIFGKAGWSWWKLRVHWQLQPQTPPSPVVPGSYSRKDFQ